MDNSMKMLRFNFLVVFLFSFNSFGQITGDERGNSSIGLNPGYKATKSATDLKNGKEDEVENKEKVDIVSFNLGTISFSTKDKATTLNYYSYFAPENFTHWYFGIKASGKVKNNFTSIFSSGNITPEASTNLQMGFRLFRLGKMKYDENFNNLTKEKRQDLLDNHNRPASDLWFVVDGELTGSKFRRFNPDTLFASQITSQKFTGYSVNAGFNFWQARLVNSTVLFGVTMGIKRKNNFDDLTESVREDTQIIVDTVSNTSRKITTKETVYTGAYKESIVYPFNMDLYFVPHGLKNLGFLIYSRTEIAEHKYPFTQLGGGIYFLTHQNSFNPLFGINMSFNDVFNNDKTDDSNEGLNKLTFGISTRINLVNRQKKSN